MKNKIILAFLLLTLTIGIASAGDLNLNNVKVPDSYKIIDDDAFYSATSNLEINIEDFDLDDVNETDNDADDTPFTNDTKYNYTVTAGDLKNTFNFTDGFSNTYGCVELVEINGAKYTVTIWGSDANINEIIENANQCMEKVNKLNNFEPLDTTAYQ